MLEELGEEWTTNKFFRLGASALLGDIERQVYHYVTGRYANAIELPWWKKIFLIKIDLFLNIEILILKNVFNLW